MRDTDNSLAMQFLEIRRTMHHMKYRKTCELHRETMEDAHIQASEIKKLKRISDTPDLHVDERRFETDHITSHNITSRKFSLI